MDIPKLTIIDVQNGKITERDMTKEEAAQYVAQVENAKREELEIIDKEKKRKSALDKLATLGLTAEEIAAL